MLADRLTAGGVRVVAVWVTAPLEVALDRLSRRNTRRVVTTPQQARWIHAEATRRAAARRFAATLTDLISQLPAVPEGAVGSVRTPARDGGRAGLGRG
jgi:shikimate kinase